MAVDILRFWTGPLPKEELYPDRKIDPFLHWFIHPAKRHLAKYYLIIRQKFFGLTVIGITGSVGKTTVKNMLLAILPQSFGTADNTTSTYNLPTTILKTPVSTKYLILEMSVEYIGDMDFYTWLAHPDIAIITTINLTHTQYLKNIETITAEKYKITRYAKHLITYKEVKPGHYKLPEKFIGSHNQINAALAAKTAQLLHIPQTAIIQGLSTFSPPSHRMQVIPLKSGSIIIDDVHNANPLATKEALKTLVQFAKKSNKKPVFIFAQMNELGAYEKSAHEQIGQLVKKLGIREFYCLGPATKFSLKSAGFGQYFTDMDSLTAAVQKLKIQNSKLVILIKGSHSWQMENLVTLLVSLS